MRAQPPGPKGAPILGNTHQYARDPFRFLRAVAAAYGDVVRFDLGPMETYLLTNPADVERILVSEQAKFRKLDFQDDALGDLLGEGLLLSEGETWRKQRELAQPAFHAERIATLTETMTGYAEQAVADWEAGEVRDIHLEMARLTVKIIVDAMMGTELDDERTRTVQKSLEPLGARFEPNPVRFLLPDRTPTRENRDYAAAVETLEGVLDDVLAERRSTERDGEPMDLLSLLLRAKARGEQTDRQIRDEMMTMLLAGHDTTALSLTYTWYLLSRHPDVEARVRAELDEVLGDGPPTAADVCRLDYTERVLQEAMRLYPPVYVLFRQPKVDVRLGGYRVPEGSAVMLSQWVVHRSGRFYDEPEAFDPDRWTSERQADRPRFAYFPFGGGPRHCIGKQFSMLEAKLILATVARNYRLEHVRDGPLRLRGSLTMHPQEPMGMRVVER